MWVLLTLFAALMQSFRNAAMSQLSAHVSPIAGTFARFIFAGPIVAVYLATLYWFTNRSIQFPVVGAMPYIVLTALFQAAATILMIKLFQQNNYAIGAGLAKSEALAAAIFGALFFGSTLNLIGALGIGIGAFAILLLSIKKATGRPSAATFLLGLLCGIMFALSSLMARESSLRSGLAFPYSAATVLLIVITIQVIILALYLAWREPKAISVLLKNWPATGLVSLTSALGSIGWFSAMALTNVAYVKTLGQIEVLFTVGIARFYLNQHTNLRDYIGLTLIGISSVLVLLS